jgi:hypothetical protein
VFKISKNEILVISETQLVVEAMKTKARGWSNATKGLRANEHTKLGKAREWILTQPPENAASSAFSFWPSELQNHK